MKSNSIYENCTEVIGNIAKFNPETISQNFPYKKIEYIDTSSVYDGKLFKTKILDLKDAPSRAKRKIKINDILISTVRPNLKHYFFVHNTNANTIVSTGFLVIRPEKIIPKYLYYFLITPKFTKYLTKIADTHTSAYPSFLSDVIETYKINIPTKKIQKFVSNILGNLDRQIMALENMNKILEEISQTIFKSWFIDYERTSDFEGSELGKIPKDWKIIKLDDFFKLIKGVSYRSQDLIFSNKALVTLKSINRGGGYASKGLKSFNGKYNKDQIVTEFDIVIAQTDLTQSADVIGKPAIIRKSSDFDTLIASLDLVIIKPKNYIIPKSYLYHLFLTTEFQNYILGYKNGTTVLHLASAGILNYKCVMPTEKILSEFDKLASCIITKIHKNNYKIEILTKIRDTLLPKLMSEELQVLKKSDSK